jgi:hypothetical protein
VGEDDESLIRDYLLKLRKAGGTVNTSILIAAATGILTHRNPTILKANGGHVELGRAWARSLMKRMGLVKRKGTQAARKLPSNFDEIKQDFLDRITSRVRDDNIPNDLIFNWDQTGVKIVPASEWTMEVVGSKQVSVTGLDDKREITVLLCVTLSGILLPPQVLYKGKTHSCHPNINFPKDWDVYHSANHWSNETTMLHYLEQVIIPYVHATRKRLHLPSTQRALAIFDVFAAHRIRYAYLLFITLHLVIDILVVNACSTTVLVSLSSLPFRCTVQYLTIQ